MLGEFRRHATVRETTSSMNHKLFLASLLLAFSQVQDGSYAQPFSIGETRHCPVNEWASCAEPSALATGVVPVRSFNTTRR